MSFTTVNTGWNTGTGITPFTSSPLVSWLGGQTGERLLQERRVPFWKETAHNNYFDGCLRDPKQLDRAFRYTRDQAVRARIVRSYSEYAHTRMNIDLNEAIQRAIRLDAFLPDVEYPRYGKKKRDEQCH